MNRQYPPSQTSYPPQQGEGQRTPPVQRSAPQTPPKGRGLQTVLMILALLVIVGVVLHSTLFRVRNISVYGNVNFTDEEVVLQSGMATGQNIFAVD